MEPSHPTSVRRRKRIPPIEGEEEAEEEDTSKRQKTCQDITTTASCFSSTINLLLLPPLLPPSPANGISDIHDDHFDDLEYDDPYETSDEHETLRNFLMGPVAPEDTKFSQRTSSEWRYHSIQSNPIVANILSQFSKCVVDFCILETVDQKYIQVSALQQEIRTRLHTHLLALDRLEDAQFSLACFANPYSHLLYFGNFARQMDRLCQRLHWFDDVSLWRIGSNEQKIRCRKLALMCSDLCNILVEFYLQQAPFYLVLDHAFPVELAEVVFLYLNPWSSSHVRQLKHLCDVGGAFIWDKWRQSHPEARIRNAMTTMIEPMALRWNGQRYGSFLMYRTEILLTPFTMDWTLGAMAAFYQGIVKRFDTILHCVTTWFNTWPLSMKNIRYQKNRDPRALNERITSYHVERCMRIQKWSLMTDVQFRDRCEFAGLVETDFSSMFAPLLRWVHEADTWYPLDEYLLQTLYLYVWKASARSQRSNRAHLIASDFE